MKKNTAGQTWLCYAFNRTTNNPVTGDASNITASIRLDSGSATATNDTNPVELSLGYYEFDLTQAETNADVIDFLPESATTSVQVIGLPPRISTNELDSIRAKTDTISSGTLSITSPVTRTGYVSIVRGDDYSNSDSRAIDFVNEDGDWPDLTSATVQFTAKNAKTDNTDFTASMSVVTASGDSQTVRLELTDTQTNTLSLGIFNYDVQATLSPSGRVVTLQRMVEGFRVLEDYT